VADSVERIKLLLEVSGDTKLLDKITSLKTISPKVDLKFSKDSIRALENLDKLSTKGFNAKLNLSLSKESNQVLSGLNKWADKGLTAKVKLEIDKDSLKAIENLDRLKEKGFGAKFGLNIDKDSIKALENLDKMKTKGFDAKFRLNIDKSSGSDYQKIERLKTKGIDVKTSLKLVGKDYQFLKKLKEDGMLIKVKRSGPSQVTGQTPISRTGLRTSTTSQEELNAREVKRLDDAYIQSQKRRKQEAQDIRALQKFDDLRNKEELRSARSDAYVAKRLFNITQSGNTFTYESPAIAARKSQLSAQTLRKLNERDIQRDLKAQQDYSNRIFSINQSVNLSRARKEEEKAAILLKERQDFFTEVKAAQNKAISRVIKNDPDTRRLQEKQDFFSFIREAAPRASKRVENNQNRNIALQQKEIQRTLSDENKYEGRLFRINQSANYAALKEKERKAKEVSRARKEVVLGAGLTLLEKGPAEAIGSILGGVVGSKFGPSGALAGSALGGGIATFTIKALESFTENVKKASEAGRSFESSILGIASVLQATTSVRSSSGGALGTNAELKFQQGQALKIQKAARARLLPLGISGEREATLVQAIVAGAAQRGIQLDGDQAATLAERLGGAIQAQRPELLNNSAQLRRDIEDLLSGLPNRTVLSSLVKGFAPGLGKATSAEQLLRASSGLASFPESLKGSSDNPIIAFQKFNSAIDQFATSAGDALNRSLVPALNKLADIVGDPKTIEGVEGIAKAIGTFATTSLNLALALDKVIKSPVGALLNPVGAITGQTLKNANDSSIETDILLRKNKLGSRKLTKFERVLASITGQTVEEPTDLTENDRAQLELQNLEDAKRLGRFNAFQDDPNRKVTETELNNLIEKAKKRVEETGPKAKTSAATTIERLLGVGFGEGATFDKFSTVEATDLPEIQAELLKKATSKIPEDLITKLENNAKNDAIAAKNIRDSKTLSPEEKRRKLQENKEASRDRAREFFKEADRNEFSAKIKDAEVSQSLFSKRRDQFDTSTPGGKAADLKDSLDGLAQILEKQKDVLKSAVERRDKIASDTESTPDQIASANAVVIRASQQLIDTRKKERDAILALNEANLARARALKESTIDPGTFAGRKALLSLNESELRKQFSDARESVSRLNRQLADTTDPIERTNIGNKIESQQIAANKSQVGLIQNSREAQNLVLDQAEATFNAKNALFNFKQATEAAKDKMEALKDQLAQSERSLEDFNAETKLRSLGRKGRLLADTRAAVRAAKEAGRSPIFAEVLGQKGGLSPFDIPEGSQGGLDLAANEAYERLKQTVNQLNPERVKQEEDEQRRSLERNKRSVEREIAGLPSEEFQRKFGTLKTLVGATQQGIKIPGSEEFIKQASKDLGIELPQLAEGKFLETTVPQDVSNISGNVAEILKKLGGNPILSPASGIAQPPKITTSSSPSDQESKINKQEKEKEKKKANDVGTKQEESGSQELNKLPINTSPLNSPTEFTPKPITSTPKYGFTIKTENDKRRYLYKADKERDPFNNDIEYIPKGKEKEVFDHAYKYDRSDQLSSGAVVIDAKQPEPIGKNETTDIYSKDKNARITNLDEYFDNLDGGSQGNVTLEKRRKRSASGNDLFDFVNFKRNKQFDPNNKENQKNLSSIGGEIDQQYSSGITNAIQLKYGENGKISDRKKFLYDNRLFFDADPEPELTAKAEKLKTRVINSSLSGLPAFPAAMGIAEAPKITPVKKDIFDQQLFGKESYGRPLVYDYQKDNAFGTRGDNAFRKAPIGPLEAGEIESQMMGPFLELKGPPNPNTVKPLRPPRINKSVFAPASDQAESSTSAKPVAAKVSSPTSDSSANAMAQIVMLLGKLVEETKNQPKSTGEEFKRALNEI